MKNTFGKTKNNITNHIVESYQNNDMKTIKKILNLIKEDKEFSEMYVLYDDVENKYFDNIDTAKYFVEELSKKINGKANKYNKLCDVINENIKESSDVRPEVYNYLDVLLENDSLLNIEKKINSKLSLLKHLTTKKDIKESNNNTHTNNEKLLMTLLSNDFNSYYGKTLSEEDKNKLKSILKLNNTELQNKINELSETISTKIDKILLESYDNELKLKLEKVKEELSNVQPTKYSYYKLMELKNGLD